MAEKKNAVIVGGGTSKFGVRQAHLLDMIQEAARACADDIPALKPEDIDGLIVATTMAGRHSSALNTAPLVVHRLGLRPTSICIRLDTLCAGSNSAIIVAKGLVESGISEVVLVTGAEKVYMPQRWETNYTQLMV
ncbi:MAG TPA: hypothetical protein VMW86_04485, partial [Dehalococcoidales bacterium]|nr:hypothetical protein [Dehalococcoidales bacterium]